MSEEAVHLRTVLNRIAELASSALDSLAVEGGVDNRQKIACTPKLLPKHLIVQAAQRAIDINPLNSPPVRALRALDPSFDLTHEHIAVMTSKRWHTKGVNLTVGFLDNPPSALRTKILLHMNAWGKTANVRFVETAVDPQVRILRKVGDGHWSYLGTDILSINASEPTMNLDGFTLDTPDSEFFRVVRHETGHTLGFPHEHMRRDLVDKIDFTKAIAYYSATQGWSADEVHAQVLTPLEDAALLGTPLSDPNSIMCYQIPGSITKNGEPILGGLDIDASDYGFASLVYPKNLSA